MTVSPSAAIRLTATAACQIIADQDRHVRIAHLSLVLLDSALVGGSLFSPTAISIIHKTSQHLLSEDGQSLAPFNIMPCIAVFQPQPSQLVQDCVNQPLSAVAWGGNVAPPPSSAYRFTRIPDAEQEKKTVVQMS